MITDYGQVEYKDRAELPSVEGLYAVTLSESTVYFGRSDNLNRRWRAHTTAQQCRKAVQSGEIVVLHYWATGHSRDIERQILNENWFPWNSSRGEPYFSKCGVVLSDDEGYTSPMAESEHMHSCELCLEISGLSTILRGIYSQAHSWLCLMSNLRIEGAQSPASTSKSLDLLASFAPEMVEKVKAAEAPLKQRLDKLQAEREMRYRTAYAKETKARNKTPAQIGMMISRWHANRRKQDAACTARPFFTPPESADTDNQTASL